MSFSVLAAGMKMCEEVSSEDSVDMNEEREAVLAQMRELKAYLREARLKLTELSTGKDVMALEQFIATMRGAETLELSGLSPQQMTAEAFEVLDAMEADCDDEEQSARSAVFHQITEQSSDVFAPNYFGESTKSQIRNVVFEIDGLYLLFFSFCQFTERRALEQMQGLTPKTWALDANNALQEFGCRVPLDAATVHCQNEELPQTLAQMTEGFVAYLPKCVMCFARGGANDMWLVAKFCDETHAAAFGWKQHAADCTQRPIASPICELPTVRCEEQWVAATPYGYGFYIAESNGTIAVGMGSHKITLLNADTGGIISTDKLKGAFVAFAEERLIGVDFKQIYKYSGTTLVNKVPIVANSIMSMKTSPNGILYVGSGREMLEFSTSDGYCIAGIPLTGNSAGNCDIGANGVLAQGIDTKFDTDDDWEDRHEDGRYCIDLIECNTRYVTQTIRTKHRQNIFHLSFNHDSTRIVSVSWDGSVQLFDAMKGQTIGGLRRGHTDSVSCVCWLNADWFVTVSSDASIVIWHIDSQEYVLRVDDAHSRGICSVHRISEHSFVTASYDGSVKKWCVDVGSADKH